MAENVREIVLDALLTLEREQEYSNRLIGAVLDKYDYLEGRDKAFIKRVTEGTLERQLELDYYLNRYSSIPVRKMKPLIRCLLRMSLYQLLYMDSVPDSAVCNEACKLAAKRGFGSLKGFVNGVLRRLAREKGALPLPDREREPEKYFSVKYSMPEWIVKLWMEEYGPEITERILAGLLRIHPVHLRLRTDISDDRHAAICNELQEAGVKLEQSNYLPYLYTLQSGDSPADLPGFSEGRFTVQDVSSALAVEAADIHPEDFVIDACAAPGGKSLLAAEKAKRVLSRDISAEKTDRIREAAERMGIENIQIQIHDATVFDESLKESADVVLLDVPCSGLGVIGKKRDIKYRVSPEGMESLVGLQREIVRVCSRYVKPGGILLYSTCTINVRENEETVRFISEELPFEPQPLDRVLPKKVLQDQERVKRLRRECGKELSLELDESQRQACVQMLPGYMEGDGFFIAGFRKQQHQRSKADAGRTEKGYQIPAFGSTGGGDSRPRREAFSGKADVPMDACEACEKL